MVEKIIKARNFKIFDKDIVTTIHNLNIEYVQLLLIKDYDNKTIISVRIIDNKDVYKNSMKIFLNKNCYIYTPNVLKKYVGKKVLCYQDTTVFRDKEELFRIKPINFEIEEDLPIDKNYNEIPYFTKSGTIVFPHGFINKYFDNRIAICNISFDQTDASVMVNGSLHLYFHSNTDRCYLSFKLKKNSSGLTTGVIKSVVRLSKLCNKNLNNFKYQSINFSEDFKLGVITFKEITNAY